LKTPSKNGKRADAHVAARHISGEFGNRLGMSAARLRCAGRAAARLLGPLSNASARRLLPPPGGLARRFPASPEFWLGRQATHDLTKAQPERVRAIERDADRRAA
jgi:hypothetical protein